MTGGFVLRQSLLDHGQESHVGTHTGTYRFTQQLTVYGSMVQVVCGTIRHFVSGITLQVVCGTYRTRSSQT